MIKLKDIILESDWDDFLNHHHTGHIASHHYDNLEDPNKSHFAKYKKSKFPQLNSTEKLGPYNVEFRQTGEKLEYCKNDENDNLIRLPDGNVVYMSDAEMKAQNLPLYDTTIVAFIDDNAVGMVSDEWGAVGVWVLKPFQRLGIGTALLDKHVELRPKLKSGYGKFGQMTNAGTNLTKKYYDMMAKRHGENWFQKLKQQNPDA